MSTHILKLGIGLACLSSVLMSPAARADQQPDAKMMAAANGVANYIETQNAQLLSLTFARRNVTIIENFAPYLFEGPTAVENWSKQMRAHLDGITMLHHTFGHPNDYSQTGDHVYFALPTIWRGLDHGKAFTESGGWAFVLVKQAARWRVQNYGWAVTWSSQG